MNKNDIVKIRKKISELTKLEVDRICKSHYLTCGNCPLKWRGKKFCYKIHFDAGQDLSKNKIAQNRSIVLYTILEGVSAIEKEIVKKNIEGGFLMKFKDIKHLISMTEVQIFLNLALIHERIHIGKLDDSLDEYYVSMITILDGEDLLLLHLTTLEN